MTSFLNMAARATVVVVLAAAIAGCGADRDDKPPRVEFAESGSAPIYPDANPDAVVSVRIANYSDSLVTVTGVKPVADRGMTVSYLGWSTCKNGCAGDGLWEDPDTRKLTVGSIDGKLPISLPAGSTHFWFVFRLRVTHPETETRLRAGCWLRMRHVELKLDSGHTLTASTPGKGVYRYVAGIHATFNKTASRPPAPSGCVTHPSQPDR